MSVLDFGRIQTSVASLQKGRFQKFLNIFSHHLVINGKLDHCKKAQRVKTGY